VSWEGEEDGIDHVGIGSEAGRSGAFSFACHHGRTMVAQAYHHLPLYVIIIIIIIITPFSEGCQAFLAVSFTHAPVPLPAKPPAPNCQPESDIGADEGG